VSDLRPLPTDLRDHLSELTGNEFKVWTAYYLRTGDYDLTSHPSNETIEKDTGLTKRTVKTSKAGLRATGWLAYTGDYKQPRSAEGVYAVPVMEVRLPWRPDWSAVVLDVNTAYDAFTTVVQKVTHGTEVQNLHPEGSIGLGLDLDSSSLSPSTIVRGAPHPVGKEGEKQETEAKPENLKPTPEPKPTPTPDKVRCAPDGTPWPEGFDSWTNARRLHWLGVHGWKQGRMAEASSQASRVVDREGKPTAIATPLHDSPDSATPPIPDCVRCDEPCTIQRGEWVCHACHLRQPVVQPPELDNWDEL
jgi:hypothetical protein